MMKAGSAAINPKTGKKRVQLSNGPACNCVRPGIGSIRPHLPTTHIRRIGLVPCPAPQSRRLQRGEPQRVRSSGAAILPLGFDILTFLGSTVVVVPLFKKLKLSPVLGFLFSGVMLQQLGLIRDPKDMEALSELGVLFLLFEMGLELSLDRLKALAKYAFGLGTLQMIACTAIFSAFALPVGQGLGTRILEALAHASPSLVSIRSVDEAVVIGGALSLSSSAFVLQLLNERGEMPTRVGSATLGILLLQDIAVVPFLVLLPVVVQLQNSGTGTDGLAAVAASGDASTLLALLGPTAMKTLASLGLLLLGGRLLLRRVFEVVAQSDNSETFVGLCLLTVAGAALATQSLGFSDTLGAFTAGVLLSESNFKTQVEADIRPFRGLLLGLFFVTTGSSVDMGVLRTNWQVILWILAGLITIKTGVIAALGPSFGLSRAESIRTGFILSQGGEFAFVLLSLAYSLNVLPENLNQVLIIVVVLSMALTPGLAELGKVAGTWVEENFAPPAAAPGAVAAGSLAKPLRSMGSMDDDSHKIHSPVVICGFGPHGQMLAALLDSPMASLKDDAVRNYVAFDLDPIRVQVARAAGFNVVYGDGSRPAVLKAAGIEQPQALAVCLTSNKVAAHRAVASLSQAYPTVPLYAMGADMRDAAELEEAGADKCIISATAAGLAMGGEILARMGASVSELSQAQRTIETAMAERTGMLADQLARYGSSVLEGPDTVLLLGRERQRSPLPPGAQPSEEGAGGLPGLAPPPSTPAPPDTLPSMKEAMPANLRQQQQPQPGLNAGPGGVGEGAGMGQGSSRGGGGAREGSWLGLEPAAASTAPGVPSGPQPASATIVGTALAKLDCDSDEECLPEEVAGLVQLDAQKQQILSAALLADQAASARAAAKAAKALAQATSAASPPPAPSPASGAATATATHGPTAALQGSAGTASSPSTTGAAEAAAATATASAQVTSRALQGLDAVDGVVGNDISRGRGASGAGKGGSETDAPELAAVGARSSGTTSDA
ncbi:Sodium/hydrogen exchanger family-domain-containing protein [Haematococcus lacustris]